jgi:hypothetical protein
MQTNRKNVTPTANERKKPLIFIPPDKRCAQRTQKGAPCRAARWRASRFCIFHDPNFRNLRKQLQERKNSALKQKSTRTAEGIQQMLESAAQDVREKRISPAEASSIGYLGQVMSANLKNLPQAENLKPRLVDSDLVLNEWVESSLNEMNAEIARWLPASSPLAVVKAERDAVRIAADASAAEAQRAAVPSAGASQPAGSPQEPPGKAGQPVGSPGVCSPLPPIAWKRAPYDP